MERLGDLPGFRQLIIDGELPVKRGRPLVGETPMTPRERMERMRAPAKAARMKHIAVLDMETNPFSDDRAPILPFTCEIYSDQFAPIVIWNENYDQFVDEVVAAIESLPDEYTIYAHNGGKFDYFFIVKALRGIVKYKGRAIMSCKIGNHELRDSLHILPERLAAWKKDIFDYNKLTKANRKKHRAEILAYQHSDCVYLFDIVKRFINEFGLKISIGQAAFGELKKHYKVAPIKESMDTALRPYFFGGRVECIAGRGIFESGAQEHGYKMMDVNSMYPKAMADYLHPISAEYNWRKGYPSDNTVFIDVSCRNWQALVSRGELDDASVSLERGRFHTTIYEFRMALKYNLIEDVEIHWCIDNNELTTFSKFIVPMYNRRIETKSIMKRLKAAGLESSHEYEETKKEDLLLKYLLNNSFGKFAQNPRKFKEYYYTDAGKMPDAEWMKFIDEAKAVIEDYDLNGKDSGIIRADYETALDTAHKYSFPVERTSLFEIWAKPSPGRRFNNVGTAASITGAARSILMEARQNSIDPIYCDTDSLICRKLQGVEISNTILGAWDLEEEYDSVIIAGKKTYCCAVKGYADDHEKRLKVRSKGADLRTRPKDPNPAPDAWGNANRETWRKYSAMLDGETIVETNRTPTMKKTGEQFYMTRRIRATAPLRSTRFQPGHAKRDTA